MRVNLGDEIKNIVQDALNNGDFKRLNQDVENIVKGALDEVRKSIDTKKVNIYNNRSNTSRSTSIQNKVNYVQVRDNNKVVVKQTKYTVPMGQVSGTLFTVFGAIGNIGFGLGAAVLTILGYAIGGKEVFHTIALGLVPFLLLSIILSMNGSRIRKRMKRFQRYLISMNNRNFGSIKDFAAATGLSQKATVRDLKKMIAMGMFPEGRIDDKNIYFMLNNDSYEQYLKLQADIKINAFEEQRKKIASEELKVEEIPNKNPELKLGANKAIDEGRQFVRQIKDANIAIPDEEISRKLDRLEGVTGKIFDYVEAHPEKLPEIKKFTEYFLPTTLKLLDAYKRLDNQPVQGENISTAKREIEETMDTINHAFENLLDDLFEDIAMDISTDISVLQTILAQEGLTEKNMKSKK